MPHLEDAWQARRKQFFPQFVETARGCNAYSITPFSHAMYLSATTTGESEGVCAGIAFEYVIQLSQGKNFIESAFVDAGAEAGVRQKIIGKSVEVVPPSPLWSTGNIRRTPVPPSQPRGSTPFNKKLHAVQESQEYLSVMRKPGTNVEALARVYQLPIIESGLKFRQSRAFDKKFRNLHSAAEFICREPDTFLTIITPNHAMSAVSERNSYRFFDPNAGEVVFNTSTRFINFFTTWFGKKLVIDGYKGKVVTKSGPSGGVPHKRLTFIIDRYGR